MEFEKIVAIEYIDMSGINIQTHVGVTRELVIQEGLFQGTIEAYLEFLEHLRGHCRILWRQ